MESLSFRLSIVGLFLILNLGLLHADFTEVVELRRKLGSGSCSKSRFGEVMQKIITCQAQGQKLRTVMNICSNKENAMKCIDDNLPECWPPEGIKAFKTITLRFILQVMSSEEIEEFKSCPIDEETIGNGWATNSTIHDSIKYIPGLYTF